MKIIYSVIFSCFIILLFSCISAPACKSVAEPISISSTVPRIIFYNSKSIVREYLTYKELYDKQKNNPDENKAYGFLLFTHIPSLDELERYKILLNEFQGRFPDISELTYQPEVKYTTYILLKKKAQSNILTLDELISNYDFSFSSVLLKNISDMNPAIKPSSNGPFLVAFDKPLSDITKSSKLISLDLSSYEDDDIKYGISLWVDFITFDKSDWYISYVTIRDKYINFINKYSGFFLRMIGA